MEKRRIQVVGGGFSGLALAYFFGREGFHVRLVEESDHFGGILQTVPTAFGLVEKAANALLSNALVEETALELGIELVPTLPSARKRFIFRHGKPRRWPLSGSATVRFLGETVPRFFLNRGSFRPKPGESVKSWGYRTLGAEATDYLLVPGLSGVYAGRAENLSASLILKRFFSGGRRITRGRLRGSVAPKRGMGEWPRGFRLWLELHGMEFAKEAEAGWPTIVALPPPRAKSFLEGKAPSLAALLSEVKMLPVVSVTCFFPDESPGINGFGCLFPRSEGFRVLGILANDRIFPGRATKGFLSETWIFGGATDPEFIRRTDEEILSTIQFERGKIVGQRVPFTHTVVNRWPAAIPHYDLGLEKALSGGPTSFTEGGYTLFGTYLGDLGLARVLVRAQELARNFK
jgi:oxygen-dependent protoporphyrinogen oxidase